MPRKCIMPLTFRAVEVIAGCTGLHGPPQDDSTLVA